METNTWNEDTSTGPRFCPWCGSQVILGRPYCSSCGKELSGDSGPSLAGKVGKGLKTVGRVVGAGLFGLFILVMTVGGFLSDFGFWDTEGSSGSAGTIDPKAVVATRQADPCAGYTTWAEDHNQKLYAVMGHFQETAAAGVEDTFTEEIREIWSCPTSVDT